MSSSDGAVREAIPASGEAIQGKPQADRFRVDRTTRTTIGTVPFDSAHLLHRIRFHPLACSRKATD